MTENEKKERFVKLIIVLIATIITICLFVYDAKNSKRYQQVNQTPIEIMDKN